MSEKDLPPFDELNKKTFEFLAEYNPDDFELGEDITPEAFEAAEDINPDDFDMEAITEASLDKQQKSDNITRKQRD